MDGRQTEVAEGQVSSATSRSRGALVTCQRVSLGLPSYHELPAGHFPCGRMYMRVAQAACAAHRTCNLHMTMTGRYSPCDPLTIMKCIVDTTYF